MIKKPNNCAKNTHLHIKRKLFVDILHLQFYNFLQFFSTFFWLVYVENSRKTSFWYVNKYFNTIIWYYFIHKSVTNRSFWKRNQHKLISEFTAIFFCWYVGWSTSGPCSSSLVINFSAWFADIFLKTTRLCDLVNNICFLMSSYVVFRVDSLFVLRL